jgi:hypothetical protein
MDIRIVNDDGTEIDMNKCWNEDCNCHTKYVDVFNPDGIKIGSRIDYSPNIKKC